MCTRVDRLSWERICSFHSCSWAPLVFDTNRENPVGVGLESSPLRCEVSSGDLCVRCASESVSPRVEAVAGDQAGKWHNDSCHSRGNWRDKVRKDRSFGVTLPESGVQRWLTLGELVGQGEPCRSGPSL